MSVTTVKLTGFDNEKAAFVSRQLPAALDKIQKLLGRPVKFPASIRPMSNREIIRSRRSQTARANDWVWDSLSREVRVNPTLTADDILLNVIRALLQSVLPKSHKLKIDDMASRVMREMTLMERSKGFHAKVMEGLSKKTLRRLRDGRKRHKTKSKSVRYLPGLIGNDDQPFNPSRGAMSGPASFGPVSVGGIIRHS